MSSTGRSLSCLLRAVTPTRADPDGSRRRDPRAAVKLRKYLNGGADETATYGLRPRDTEGTQPVTSAVDPTDDPRPLVDSPAAAEALRTSHQQLHRWADAGIVSPARTDPDGRRWWSLHDLRRELAAYMDDHRDDDRPR